MGNYRGYDAIQGRGAVALPAELRRKYRLDEPGAQLEVVERPADGVIELRPTLPVPLDEMWFWTRGHQAAELEAEEDLAAGGSARSMTRSPSLLTWRRWPPPGRSPAGEVPVCGFIPQ